MLLLLGLLLTISSIWAITAGVHNYDVSDDSAPRVALTFDDGPHATLTPKLLDICATNNVRVTFFVVGQRIKNCRHIIKMMVAEGHEIGNHTWSHPKLTALSRNNASWQVARAQDAIAEITNHQPILFRPPYGATNANLNNYLTEKFGLKIIMWSVDPCDWRRPGSTVVAKRVLNYTQDGSIILLHDIHDGTIEAVPIIIERLLIRGFKFVTVSEILKIKEDG